MAMETKQLHNLSKVYNEQIAVTEVLGGTPGDGYIGHPKLNIKNPISPPKVKTKTSTNKGLAGKLGNRANQLSDAMKEENIDEMDRMGGPAAIGAIGAATIGLAKSGIDAVKNVRGKLQKATDKKNKKLKQYESYSNWRQDLKEIPDYEQIPASSKKRNEKISEKNVKNTIKINPEMKEEVVDENLIKFIKNPKATIQKAVDKKLTSATKKGSIGGIKVGGSASRLGSISSGPLNTEEKRWQDDDGDGKWYEKSDVDGKISKREKKAKKHNCASKVKHEQFGIGDCISEAHDLDENGNVAHYDVEFEEYIVKGVPVEELQILEQQMHEHVIHEQKKSYETTKRKEVLAALKRDKRPLDKKTKEKIAAKIVKDKGDTSKSDDRYAYEDHVWDKVADMLTELGKLNDVEFRVEGYQRDPEKGERKEREANKKYERVRGERTPMPPRGNKRREEFERWYAANVR